ncbi:MAG: DNA polymerase III subunit epsilon [Alphaproteobacteria bacterium]
MREIVLDTETTGLDPNSGHRVVEIGCIELVNHVATGAVYQTYVNPERDMPRDALEVHGLSQEFLNSKPRFAEVVDDFLSFIGDARLVIHNADFDLGFLNAELGRIAYPTLSRARVVDTVQLARRKYPGAPANLDALCRRFDIDTTARGRHRALLDAQLLAEVYLQLLGGRQPGLALAAGAAKPEAAAASNAAVRPPRPHAASNEERAAHAAFVDRLKDPIWRD